MLEIATHSALAMKTPNNVSQPKDFDLTYLEEAYTSEHWLVRIYRVKKPDEFNR